MTRPHIARDVVVDYERSEILIEGVALPFFVHPDIEVEPAEPVNYPLNVVRIGILAENVTLRTLSLGPRDCAQHRRGAPGRHAQVAPCERPRPVNRWRVRSRLLHDGRVWGVYDPDPTWPFVAWFLTWREAHDAAVRGAKGGIV